MLKRMRRSVIAGTASLAALAAALIITTPSAGQSGSTAAAEQDFRLAVVTGNDVYIRSGPADSYYPFGKAKAGQVVKVLGDKFNWARIAAEGPAFRSLYGYVKVPRGQESSKLRVAEDGKTGIALGRIDIVAPNLNAKNDPAASWKSLLRLQPDDRIDILETSQTERDTIYRVALPKAVNGWITAAYLRDASPEEARAFADAPEATKTTKLAQAPSVEATPPAAATPEGEAPVETSPAPKPAADTAVAQAPVEQPTPTAAREEAPVAAPPAVTAREERTATPTTTDVLASDAPPAATEAPARVDGPSPSDLPVEEALLALETMFEQLQSEPMETAEVMPLRGLYLEIADRAEGESRATARYARARAEQLAIWADLQQQRQELKKLRTRIRMSAEEAEAVRLALDTRRGYTAMGRMVASTIFDGSRLPRLMRLQEPGSGRTVAYLRPTREYDLAEMVDQLVGVIGTKEFDQALRLNVVRPERIDLLAPKP